MHGDMLKTKSRKLIWVEQIRSDQIRVDHIHIYANTPVTLPCRCTDMGMGPITIFSPIHMLSPL